MAKISVSDLIGQFEYLYRASPPYVWGGSSLTGMDCSGAFVWAYKQHGLYIAHGSNTIARSYAAEILPIIRAEPGMAAFKARKPGEKGYALPEKFQPGGSAYNGDLNDYYHIGLVGENGHCVYNAQSKATGFVRSKTTAGWSYCAKLKAVDYETGDDEPMVKMVITAASGSTVNVRKQPSENAPLVDRLPIGTVVDASDDRNGWRAIIHGGVSGYVKAQFLSPYTVATPTDMPVPTPVPSPEPLTPTGDTVLIQLPRATAQAILEALEATLGVG